MNVQNQNLKRKEEIEMKEMKVTICNIPEGCACVGEPFLKTKKRGRTKKVDFILD